jgi:hypothetical protein
VAQLLPEHFSDVEVCHFHEAGRTRRRRHDPFQISRRAGRHDVSSKRRHVGMADGGRELREDRVE